MTVIVDAIGMHFDRHWYIENDHEHILARLLVSLAFMNQAWNLTVSPLSNGPYWSLCYEVWYYVIFGVLFFVRPTNVAYLVALFLAALVGPRIVLLFSIWLIGVACYHLAKRVDD
jgi:peptidoglycan/LPS O-acetylase OafA/YrhL